jgi:hypothetical protein
VLPPFSLLIGCQWTVQCVLAPPAAVRVLLHWLRRPAIAVAGAARGHAQMHRHTLTGHGPMGAISLSRRSGSTLLLTPDPEGLPC